MRLYKGYVFMKAVRLLCALGAIWSYSTMSAIASPKIASGDGVINAALSTCLTRTHAFVNTLDVSVERGEIVRTGYFGDGSFRILCYPNPYASSEQSLVVIFAAHESNLDVADAFVQIALSEIADPELALP